MSEGSRPILVTGSHRSGTTWVGRVLAESHGVGYIHEPFNLGTSRGICRAPIEHWFTHVTEANEDRFADALRDTLAFRYSVPAALAEVRSRRDLRERWYELRRFLRYRLQGLRPLMKDPIALLSAEWLAHRFDMRVVVMIRHPAAFASSLKRLDWSYPFAHLLEQPLLMRGPLADFEEEIRWFAGEKQDIVDQAALLWSILYSVVDRYRADHEDWLFLRQEDLARAPVVRFGEIFEHVGLPYTDAARTRVSETSGAGNERSPADPHAIARDSRATILKWRRELTPAEIERVRERTDSVAGRFYSDDEWA